MSQGFAVAQNQRRIITVSAVKASADSNVNTAGEVLTDGTQDSPNIERANENAQGNNPRKLSDDVNGGNFRAKSSIRNSCGFQYPSGFLSSAAMSETRFYRVRRIDIPCTPADRFILESSTMWDMNLWESVCRAVDDHDQYDMLAEHKLHVYLHRRQNMLHQLRQLMANLFVRLSCMAIIANCHFKSPKPSIPSCRVLFKWRLTVFHSRTSWCRWTILIAQNRNYQWYLYFR